MPGAMIQQEQSQSAENKPDRSHRMQAIRIALARMRHQHGKENIEPACAAQHLMQQCCDGEHQE